MYDGFLSAIKWLGTTVTANVVTVVLLCTFLWWLIYQIAVTIIISKCRKENDCACRIIGKHLYFRRVFCAIALILAIFSLLVITAGKAFSTLMIVNIMLPIIFLVLIYLIDAIFSYIYRCCCCCCSDDCDCCKVEKKPPQIESILIEEVTESKRPSVLSVVAKKTETQSQKDKKAHVAKNKSTGLVKIETEIKKSISAITKTTTPKKQRENASNARSQLAKKSVLSPIEEKKKSANDDNKSAKVVASKSLTEKASVNKSSATRSPRQQNRIAKPKAAIEEKEIQSKIEKIENLGVKIENQRKQAEIKTDHIVEESDTPYVAQTQEALVKAQQTATRMDELKQRMGMLRQSAIVRDVETVEAYSRDEQSAQMVQKVTLENGIETDREVLSASASRVKVQTANQFKNSEVIDGEGSILIDSENIAVNKFTTGDTSGKAQQISNRKKSKASTQGKYNADDVMAALYGLKSAMDKRDGLSS